MHERACKARGRWRPRDDDEIRIVEEADLFHSIHEASAKSNLRAFHFADCLEDYRMR